MGLTESPFERVTSELTHKDNSVPAVGRVSTS